MIDIQNDFMPTGALPVPCADEIIPVANHVQTYFNLIIATQDWHPANHKSFAINHLGYQPGQMITLAGLPQILWPEHCVQNTKGAELVATLATNRIARFVKKGMDPNIDSYSGFFDNGHRKSTELHDYLIKQQVTSIYLLGLATDYCVFYSALDARQLGFNTYLIEDGCRGVNLQPNGTSNAIHQMKAVGVHIIQSTDLSFIHC